MRYLFIFMLLLLTGCQTGFYRGPASDHFDGKRFFYPGEQNKSQDHFYDLISLWTAVLQNPWTSTLPTINYTMLQNYPDGIKVTFINHATVLIQSSKVNVLIDPIYSVRASPIPWIGPKRVRQPGVPFLELPKIDVVLISHNHYDHMDISTLKQLNKRYHPHFIVPLGNKVVLKHYGIQDVEEIDWWQKSRYEKAKITFLPAHHTTQRGLMDFNRTLWGSFGLQLDGKKIYFAGDTSYAHHFKEIRTKWGQPDFSFIPIGAYEPRELLKPHHVNPLEAVKAHLDLGSGKSLGIHWGTFQLSSESMDQPIIDLILARKVLGVSAEDFIVIQEGKPFNLENKRHLQRRRQ